MVERCVVSRKSRYTAFTTACGPDRAQCPCQVAMRRSQAEVSAGTESSPAMPAFASVWTASVLLSAKKDLRPARHCPWPPPSFSLSTLAHVDITSMHSECISAIVMVCKLWYWTVSTIFVPRFNDQIPHLGLRGPSFRHTLFLQT